MRSLAAAQKTLMSVGGNSDAYGPMGKRRRACSMRNRFAIVEPETENQSVTRTLSSSLSDAPVITALVPGCQPLPQCSDARSNLVNGQTSGKALPSRKGVTAVRPVPNSLTGKRGGKKRRADRGLHHRWNRCDCDVKIRIHDHGCCRTVWSTDLQLSRR